MSKLVRVCAAADLPADGEVASFDADGEPVAIVATEDEYFAIRDECSHQEVPLSEGGVDGYTIECWMHGSCFDLRTGAPVNLPANVPVPVYPLKFEGDDVLISIEES